jgi:hypothetical protein
MGQNLDDYPDFQKIPGMPILLQHSVYRSRAILSPSLYAFYPTSRPSEPERQGE